MAHGLNVRWKGRREHMFDKFGEFDSAEEINRAAAAQKAEGDDEAVMEIARENGIDKEDAQDFIEGHLDGLTTPLLAALGKLKIEKDDLKLTGVLSDWVDELNTMCTESTTFAEAVRKKGRELAGYIALTAESGYEHRAVVDKRIVDKTSSIKTLTGGREFAIGIPDKKTRRAIAEKYYLGEENT